MQCNSVVLISRLINLFIFLIQEMREFNEEYKEASKTDKLKLLKSKFSVSHAT